MAVQKLGSGGTVIVRTGQLAGVGPIGPKGAKGDVGPAGPAGAQGDTGPAGNVIEQIAIAPVASAQSIGTGATISVSRDSIIQDDGGWWQSATNIEFNESQAFLFNAWVEFSKPASDGTGYRELYLLEDGASDVVLARAQVPAVALDDTVVAISIAFVADPDATYLLKAHSTDALSVAINSGRISINRIGAGPAGPVGPQGEQGDTGPVGPQGEKGDDGDANDGFDTIGDLGE